MAGDVTGGDLSRLRQLNAQAVIKVLQGGSSLTLTEVAKSTGLSRASAEDVVRELLQKGWVAEAGATAGGVGRPARRYRFRSEAGRVLGVDIGGHKIRAVVADLDGEVQHGAWVAVTPEMVARTPGGGGPGGRGVPGGRRADRRRRVGLGRRHHRPGGRRRPGAAVGGAARVDRRRPGRPRPPDGPRPGAGGERRQAGRPGRVLAGVARYAKDLVFLLAGLRTGAGLIIDGKLHRGFANASGEIGALPVLGWIRAQEHLVAASGEAGDVFAAAREGDKTAVAAVRRYVKDLALGASALVLTLDPQMVVVGGGYSRSADVLIEPLRRELDRWCIRTPEVRMSALGDEAVVLGAVRLALDDVEDRVLDGRSPLVSHL